LGRAKSIITEAALTVVYPAATEQSSLGAARGGGLNVRASGQATPTQPHRVTRMREGNGVRKVDKFSPQEKRDEEPAHAATRKTKRDANQRGPANRLTERYSLLGRGHDHRPKKGLMGKGHQFSGKGTKEHHKKSLNVIKTRGDHVVAEGKGPAGDGSLSTTLKREHEDKGRTHKAG